MRTTTSLLISLVLGCGGSGGGGGGGGGDDDAGPDATPDSGADAGVDEHDDFDHALEIQVGTPESGVIQEPGDHDFFVVDVPAATWVYVLAAPDAEPLDTVVTVYDADRRRFAENDDSPAGGNSAELLFHAEPGSYYVEVQDYASWSGDGDPRGDDTFTYRLLVTGISDADDVATIELEPDPGNDVPSAIPLDATPFIVAGLFGAGDVDVFSFTSAGLAAFRFAPWPSGDGGNGSGTPIARAWVTDSTGSTILARSESDPPFLLPPVIPDTYLLFVEAGPAGTPSYWSAVATLGDDNPLELEAGSGQNDTSFTAEVLTGFPAEGGAAYYILAYLPFGDRDFFAFDAVAPRVHVTCGARSSGSGLTDLTVELHSPADEVLATATETADEAAVIDFDVESGVHTISLAAGGQLADVVGTYVRCGIVVTGY